LVGWLLDHVGVIQTVLGLSFTFVLSNSLSLIPHNGLQIITFVLVSIENTAMFAIYFSYMAIAFGFSDYGKLLGISSLTIAVVGLLEYPLFDTVVSSNNFMAMNLSFMATSIALFSANVYVLVLHKKGGFLRIEKDYESLMEDAADELDYTTTSVF